MELHFLKFNPVYGYLIWDWNKLEIRLNKDCNQDCLWDSLGMSVVENNETLVSEGELKGESLK